MTSIEKESRDTKQAPSPWVILELEQKIEQAKKELEEMQLELIKMQ
jgi:hypothetical protein